MKQLPVAVFYSSQRQSPRRYARNKSRNLQVFSERASAFCCLQYNFEEEVEVMPRHSKSADKSDTRALAVYLDADSQRLLVQAAELRRISVSDYVRAVTIPQAHREVEAARRQTISLSAEEQLAFWQALHAPAELTPAQKQPGTLMQGRR